MIPTPPDDQHRNDSAGDDPSDDRVDGASSESVSSESTPAPSASNIRLGEDSLRHLFAGCCEYAFAAELGVADPPLVDYMVEMLLRFLRSEAFQPVRNPRGQKLARITELLAEAEQREGRPKRDLVRHIGDVTLFWTGVYPEALPKIQSVDSADFLVDLPSQGRRCYQIAGELTESVEGDPEAAVFWRIAQEYTLCQEGLTIARREWEAIKA